MLGVRGSGTARCWQGAGVVALLLAAASPALGGDRFSVQVSLERNDLQSERLGLLRELKDLEARISEAEAPVSVSGSVSRVHSVHSLRASHVAGLRNQRQALLGRLDAIDRRFERLTSRVVSHYGERPPWWNDLE